MSQLTKFPLSLIYPNTRPVAGIKGQIIPTPDGIAVIYNDEAELRECLFWHKFFSDLSAELEAKKVQQGTLIEAPKAFSYE